MLQNLILYSETKLFLKYTSVMCVLKTSFFSCLRKEMPKMNLPGFKEYYFWV